MHAIGLAQIIAGLFAILPTAHAGDQLGIGRIVYRHRKLAVGLGDIGCGIAADDARYRSHQNCGTDRFGGKTIIDIDGRAIVQTPFHGDKGVRKALARIQAIKGNNNICPRRGGQAQTQQNDGKGEQAKPADHAQGDSERPARFPPLIGRRPTSRLTFIGLGSNPTDTNVRKSGEERAMTRKAIFITGGGSGIGRAVAQYFAAQGWFIGLADVNAAGIDGTAALLPDGASSRHVMDVRDRDQWRAALNSFAQASGGRLDVLFNNAGIGTGGQFADLAPEEMDRLIAINFGGVVNGIIMALPLLRATPGATILNTGSASGFYGVGGLAVYSATKFAVRGLTEGLEIEFAKYGLKVRSLMPGFIDTPLLDQVSADSNEPARNRLADGGFDIIPVEQVAQAAWQAVHGDRVHVPVGKLARRLSLLSRLFPGLIARQSKKVDGLSAG